MELKITEIDYEQTRLTYQVGVVYLQYQKWQENN